MGSSFILNFVYLQHIVRITECGAKLGLQCEQDSKVLVWCVCVCVAEPLSLQHLSRVALRSALGKRALEVVPQLGLPNRMIYYLTYTPTPPPELLTGAQAEPSDWSRPIFFFFFFSSSSFFPQWAWRRRETTKSGNISCLVIKNGVHK